MRISRPFTKDKSRMKEDCESRVGYSFAIAALTMMLTLTGFVAALWHVAWWIGVVLVATVILCVTLVMVIRGHSLSPESDAEKELKNRYMQYRIQQGKRGRQD